MSDPITGIPGVDAVRPGTHVCALYSEPAERDRLLLPFLQEGLRHGDRCVCLIDDLEPVSKRLRVSDAAGPTEAHRPGRLGFYPAPDACIRAGELPLRQTLSAAAQGSSTADFSLLRAAGEMSWLPQEVGANEVFAYESAVTQILAELPAVFLCFYDLHRFGAGTLVTILRVHSAVLLVDGSMLHNPHSLAATEYPTATPEAVPRYRVASTRTGRMDADEQWLSLTGAEVRVAGLVASGKTNRAAAEELLVSPHTVDAHLKHIYMKLDIHSRVELTVLALRNGTPAG